MSDGLGRWVMRDGIQMDRWRDGGMDLRGARCDR